MLLLQTLVAQGLRSLSSFETFYGPIGFAPCSADPAGVSDGSGDEACGHNTAKDMLTLQIQPDGTVAVIGQETAFRLNEPAAAADDQDDAATRAALGSGCALSLLLTLLALICCNA